MSDFESGNTTTFPAPLAASRMVVADFDGDGDADILFQTGGNGTAFQYALNNGNGTFSITDQFNSRFAGLTLPDNAGGTHYAGDFDGDGDIDLLAAVGSTIGSYFRNDGLTFVSASSATFPQPAAATRIVTGDFDGDGDEDILYQSGANGTAFQYARSNGDGTFSIFSQASSPFVGVSFVDHNGSNYMSGDFDGDGDVDLVGTTNATTGEFYRNNGNGTFSEASTATFPQPAAGGRQTAGDFDADGDLDILYQMGANTTPFQYARSNGDGTFTILALADSPFAGLTLPDHNGGNYFAADFDGDGDTDLFAGVNGTTGSYFYQVGKPPAIVSSTPADNASGVAVGASIQVVFDESVSKGSGNIYLYRGDGVLIEWISVNSAQVTGSGTTWTIDPSVTLSGLTNYYVLLDAGTFRDADNAEFAGIDNPVTLNFTTASANTPPTVGANAGLAVSEGATGTITTAQLDFNDAQQADTAITYTVTSLATNGTLRLNGTALGLNGSFTQDDVNNNRVSYLHDGSETTSGAFGFSVSDGVGGTVAGQSFAFTVTPVNDAPAGADKTIVLEEGDVYAFSLSDFSLSDAEGDSLAAVVITTAATDGKLYLNGAPISGVNAVVSAADIAGGLLNFVIGNNENGTGYATFTFQVRDSGGTANGGQDTDQTPNTMTIDVTAVNDAPVNTVGATVNATEDAVNVVLSTTGNAMSVSDVEATGDIVYSLSVAHGTLTIRTDVVGGLAAGDVTGNGTAEIGITGTIAEINATLAASNALLYTPTANYNGSDTLQVYANDAGQTGSDPNPVSIVPGLGAATEEDYDTRTIVLAAVDDAAVAQDDAFALYENESRTGGAGALFANNGSGVDSDSDGPALSIAEVNGSAANVGTQITLASGALLTVNADGSFSYDPNGQFNYLISLVKSVATGALNVEAFDSFTYALAGGNTVTVTVAVVGYDGSGDQLWGSASDDTINGYPIADYFDLSQGGEDTANGLDGNDAFYFGAAFTGGDTVDGGAGNNDQIGLEGNYTGANALVLEAGSISGVEVISALPGFDYSITTVDGNVAAGGELRVFGGNLGAGDNLTFDGSAETDGAFKVYGGLGSDDITTGAGNDGIYFGPGKFDPFLDRVDGGAGGNDQLALDGTYLGLTLDGIAIQNIEVIALLKGVPGDLASYDLTLANSLTGAGQTTTIWGAQLETTLLVAGQMETDGKLRIFGGSADDSFIGGMGDDWFCGGLGFDAIGGYWGSDTFYYESVAHSSAAAWDYLSQFDDNADKIDLPTQVTGFAAAVTGTLSLATLTADLASAASGLGAGQALVFTANAGTYSGRTFLIVDGDGTAGYQANGDFLFEMVSLVGTIDNVGMFV